VRSLQFGGVDAKFSRVAKTAGVIFHHAKKFEVGQLAVGLKLLKFAQPFVDAVKIRKRGVEAAKIEIGDGLQRRLGGESDLRFRVVRVGDQRDLKLPSLGVVASQVDKKAVVAHRQPRA